VVDNERNIFLEKLGETRRNSEELGGRNGESGGSSGSSGSGGSCGSCGRD